ncbi:hypothetical protein BJX99DRAFT_259544 [Aspergillus californicus]
MPLNYVEIYIAFGRRSNITTGLIRNFQWPRHWLLMLAGNNADPTKCTYHHVFKNKTLLVEHDKPLENEKIGCKVRIATIPSTKESIFWESVRKVPPQRCQDYVMGVLKDLEENNVIPEGSTEYWQRAVEPTIDEYFFREMCGGSADNLALLSEAIKRAEAENLGDLEFDTCCL